MVTNDARSQHLINRPGSHYSPGVQHQKIISICGSQVKIVDDSDGGQSQRTYSLQQIDLVTQVQMIGGLVEKEDLWLLGESSGKLHSLSLPS